MQRMPSSAPNRPLTLSNDSDIEEHVRKIELARGRWEEEARLPPMKAYSSQRHDMELENREVERQMLQLRGTSTGITVFQTYLGQDRPFSKSLLPRLKKG